jgi:amino acid adenylation domain-containing protein
MSATLLERPRAVAPRGDEPHPLRPAQRRWWIAERIRPADPLHVAGIALRLGGELDVAALERAFAALAARHPALRSAVAMRGGVPAWVPAGAPVLEVDDLTALAAAVREDEARRLAMDALARPFDLAGGAPLRARLLRIAPGDHVLAVALHRAAGASLRALFRALDARYQGAEPATRRTPSPEGDGEDARAWWAGRLRGAPVLELPTDRPRPRTPALRAATHRAVIEAGAADLPTLVAAAAVVLARTADQREIVLGVADGEGDALPVRIDLGGAPSFRALAMRTARELEAARAHRGVTVGRIAQALKLRRDAAVPLLFQAAIEIDDGEAPRLSGLACAPFAEPEMHLPLDLRIRVRREAGGVLALSWDYPAALFDAATVARMAGHFGVLLAAAAVHPACAVARLPLLTDAERAQLHAWSRGAAGPGDDRPIHLRIAGQARRTPDAPAVLFGGETATFAELDARANRLARHLRRRGVTRGALVGVCMERGIDLVAAILAVHRAGAAYLPLDPAYPADRVAYMLEDSGARLAITQGDLAGRFAAEVELVRVDADRAAIAAEPADAPPGGAGADDLAYLLYTSGSTGRPKGVCIEQRSLASTLAGTGAGLGIGPGDVAHALASFAFDIWLFEALLPLAFGAAVRIVAYPRVLETDRLAAELAEATVLHAVPALMRAIADEVRRSGRPLAGMRRVFVGGEAVPPDLLAQMRAAFPAAEISVLYGPTEGTIICARHAVTGAEGERRMLGRPLPGARLELRDAAGEPVPCGVAGELYIAGAGVARGYHGRPALTAERFLPDPSSPEPGARTYRTGDRARRLADGSLEFLGRADHQVKIRGFRVEPGEVEAVLAEHPAVGQAAVLVADGAAGEKLLRAFVVPSAEARSAAGLRGFLRERLPEHMVPAAIARVSALPLSPTGKIDRRALAAMAPDGGESISRAPEGAVERVVAAAFAEAAGKGMGMDDDFFAAGGGSLELVRLVARLEEVFRAALPPGAVFAAPNPASVAALVVAHQAKPGMAEKIATVFEKIRGMSTSDVRGALTHR